jgi:hypothetical protein
MDQYCYIRHKYILSAKYGIFIIIVTFRITVMPIIVSS